MGLGYWRSMGLVILPQALKLVIPGIVNTFIALFKDTSLVIIIGLFDLLNSVKQAAADPKWLGMATEGYVFAAWCSGFSVLVCPATPCIWNVSWTLATSVRSVVYE